MKMVYLRILSFLFLTILPGVHYAQIITVTAGSITNCPGQVIVPLAVSNGNNLGAISLKLNFNNSQLTYVGFQNQNAALSANPMSINSVGNSIILGWASDNAVNLGNGTLVELLFMAVPGNSNLTWDTQTPGSCEFSNSSGSVIQSSFVNGIVNILQPPLIITQPVNQSVHAGSTAVFRVTATGAGLGYLWQVSADGGFNWNDLVNDPVFSGVTSSSLSVANAPLTFNNYQFRCWISGTCSPSVYSDIVTLKVTDPVITRLENLEFCPGNVVIPVKVTNFKSVAAFSLSFTFDTTLLTFSGHQSINSVLTEGTFASNAAGGKVYLSWYSTTAETMADGTLVELLFSARQGSTPLKWETTTPGNCEYSTINGDLLPAAFTNGNIWAYTPPSIITNPGNKTVAKGQNTTFSLTAQGTGLSYQWQISADSGVSWSNLNNGGPYLNVTNPVLQISGAMLSMNGNRFRCQISGSCPPVVYSTEATLTVLPNIITSCQAVSGCPGEIAVPVKVSDFINVGAFSMVLNINPSLLTFTGYQNLNPLLNEGFFSANGTDGIVHISWFNTIATTLSPDEVLFELRFNGSPGSGALTWETQTAGHCEYSDINGTIIFSTWNNGSVTIYQQPEITKQPTNATIYSGGITTFTVTASATGPVYLWQFSTDGGFTWSDIVNTTPYSGGTSATLKIVPADISMNSYQFRCKVSGTCAPEVYSDPAVLTVTPAAITTVAGSIANACSGNLLIPVIVTNCNNVGGISLSLNFDPEKLTFDGYQTVNSELFEGLLVVNATTSQVRLSWISAIPANIDSGVLVIYRFKAVPSVSANLTWDIQTPGNCEYSTFQGSTLTSFYTNSSISVAANALVVDAGYDASIPPGGSAQLNGTVSGGSTPYTYSWSPSTGLSSTQLPNPVANPSDNIVYILTATDHTGCSASDNVKIAVSLNLPAVTTTPVSDITYTTALGGGNVTSDGGATISSKGVCWSTTDPPTIYDNSTSDGSGTGVFTSSLSGLVAGTLYYVRAYATNSAGTAYGSSVSFSTPTLPKNQPPLINSVTAVSPILEDAGLQTVYLSGIDDGDPDVVQQISISASSSNVSVIPNPTVQYNPNDPNGTISFTPYPDKSGMATLSITVMDDGGTANGGSNSTTISFAISVLPVNDPPVANAGQGQSVTSGQLVTLNASGSFDPEADSLRYLWTAPAGIVLSDPSLISPTFSTPVSCISNQYIFNLVVNDGQYNSLPDHVVITTVPAPPDIHLSPASFSEKLISGDGSAKTLKVKNQGFCILSFSVSSTASWLSFYPGFGTIIPGDSLIISVHFSASNLNAGFYASDITVKSNDTDQSVLHVPVSLQVTGEPLLALSDTLFNFGSVFIGQKATWSLIINNIGRDSLHVYSISSDTPQFYANVSACVIPPQKSKNVIITFQPGAVVQYSGTLTIQSDNPLKATDVVHLNGVGSDPPVISIMPESLSAVLYANQSTSQQLVIQNSGSNILSFSAQENASWLNLSAVSGNISAGNQVAINLTFNSSSIRPGIYSTILIISSNDPLTPSVSVPVYFEIYAPLAVLASASPQELCQSGSVALDASPNGGSGSYSYSWTSDPAGFTSTLKNPTVNPSSTTTYYLTISDGFEISGASVVVTVYNNEIPAAVTNMLPGDNLTIPVPTVLFSWQPSEFASAYDLYVWEASSGPPTQPTVKDIKAFQYSYDKLTYATSYYWKVAAKNPCSQTESEVMRFTVADLPDLVVRNISVPVNPSSGQTIEISWNDFNQGNNRTLKGEWFDAVYLSDDTILNKDADAYLGGKPNLTSLPANTGFTQSLPVVIPIGDFGSKYLLVKTDNYQYEIESDESNNTSFEPIEISLTPPPDLQVQAVNIPTIAFSGQTITVDWTVTNSGTGNVITKPWTDAIYLSREQVFNVQNSTRLGSWSIRQNLSPDSSYSVSKQVTLPNYISGNYFIYVVTDVYNNVFEFANENNNVRSSVLLDIVLTPPPDLTVSDIQNPATASNSESVKIQWIIKNQGSSSTTPSWTDKVYFCNQQVFNSAQSIEVGSKSHTAVLPAGGSDTINLQIITPDTIAGQYYIFVFTDYYNNVFEYLNESNNLLRSDQPILIQSADLEVIDPIIPDTTAAGQSILLSWKDLNLGSGAIIDKTITDKIWFSGKSSFPIVNPVEIGSLSYSGTIQPGGFSTKSRLVNIPDGISGKYYLFISTNTDRNVFENGLTDNNYVLDSIFIKESLYPDLVLDSISNPSSLQIGVPNTFFYRLKNNGNSSIFGKSWKDHIYASASENPDTANAIKLSVVAMSQSLPVGKTYPVSLHVTPDIKDFGSLSQGYLHFYTDAKNDVFEKTESNNGKTTLLIPFNLPPPIDLKVVSLSAPPDTTQSGQVVHFNYSVKNISTGTQIWDILKWNDGVFLSTDTLWDNNDPLIAEWLVTNMLATDSAYSGDKWFSIPNGLSGEYYFIIVTDHTRMTNDLTYLNNSRSFTGGVPVYIKETLYPDLKIEEFRCPFDGTAGQPMKFSWKVSNRGAGPSTNNAWSDQVYLSTDYQIESGDILLASKNISAKLEVNDSYTDSVIMNIPSNVNGNYIVIFRTDATERVYETAQGEANNLAFAGINIIQPALSDLIINGITFPDTVETGESVNIQYSVINTGDNPARGNLRDILWFSSDSAWNYTDPQISVRNYTINIAPQISQPGIFAGNIPGLLPGDYYVVAKTNVLNNIPEISALNNTVISTTRVNVGMPALVLGNQRSDILNDNQGRYYEIEIPPQYQGETIQITLKADSIQGINEMFLSFDTIPTRSNHSYAATEPFKGNQVLVVPEVKSGKYYLLVYGYTNAGDNQNINLIASIIPFNISSINANKGGNAGKVTVIIHGARFEDNMQVTLTNGSGDTHIAENVLFINSTKLFATFNLNNAKLGMYNVVAQKTDYITATLENGFEITIGSSGNSAIDASGFSCHIDNLGFDDQINTDVQHPASTRPNRLVKISIHFENQGNVDIPSPGRMLVSLTGTPLSFDPQDFSAELKELYIEFTENNGPPGILRPGAQGTVNVYTKATIIANLQFVLTQ